MSFDYEKWRSAVEGATYKIQVTHFNRDTYNARRTYSPPRYGVRERAGYFANLKKWREWDYAEIAPHSLSQYYAPPDNTSNPALTMAMMGLFG